jgi:hypothetical protein
MVHKKELTCLNEEKISTGLAGGYFFLPGADSVSGQAYFL